MSKEGSKGGGVDTNSPGGAEAADGVSCDMEEGGRAEEGLGGKEGVEVAAADTAVAVALVAAAGGGGLAKALTAAAVVAAAGVPGTAPAVAKALPVEVIAALLVEALLVEAAAAALLEGKGAEVFKSDDIIPSVILAGNPAQPAPISNLWSQKGGKESSDSGGPAKAPRPLDASMLRQHGPAMLDSIRWGRGPGISVRVLLKAFLECTGWPAYLVLLFAAFSSYGSQAKRACGGIRAVVPSPCML